MLKTAVCDDWVTIGSSNFDRWNFRWNLEANQEVFESRFADQVVDMFEQRFSGRVRNFITNVGASDHRYLRLWEQVFGRLVDMWLYRLGKGRKND